MINGCWKDLFLFHLWSNNMDMWVIIVLIECTVVCECVWQRVVCLLSQLHALTKFLKEQMMMPQTQKEKKKEAVE